LPRVGAAQDLTGIPGQPPRAGNFPPGCRFAARCGYAVEPECTAAMPVLLAVEDERTARCVRTAELDLIGVGA